MHTWKDLLSGSANSVMEKQSKFHDLTNTALVGQVTAKQQKASIFLPELSLRDKKHELAFPFLEYIDL